MIDSRYCHWFNILSLSPSVSLTDRSSCWSCLVWRLMTAKAVEPSNTVSRGWTLSPDLHLYHPYRTCLAPKLGLPGASQAHWMAIATALSNMLLFVPALINWQRNRILFVFVAEMDKPWINKCHSDHVVNQQYQLARTVIWHLFTYNISVYIVVMSVRVSAC